MFADVMAQNRQKQQYYVQRKADRAAVYYAADQVFLAVYHKRPKPEVQDLLAKLALLTGQGVV